jgi:hypothetical protein
MRKKLVQLHRPKFHSLGANLFIGSHSTNFSIYHSNNNQKMVQDWMISSTDQEFCQPNWWPVTEFLVNLLKKDLNLEERRRGLCRYALCPKLQADKFRIISPWNCPFVHYC